MTEIQTSVENVPSPNAQLPQLTLRAILTGMILGGVLSLCNIYSGLKIGWGFNMSITAALLSYGFFQSLHKFGMGRSWNIYENNINQTAASSAASISSAGLVAPIPALTMLTGQQLTWPQLALWTFSVALVGVVVAVGLRRQMLMVDKLPFPGGIATAETLKQMYARGTEAMARVRMLLGGAVIATIFKIIKFSKVTLPGSLSTAAGGLLQKQGVKSLSLKNLTFQLDASLMMMAVGALIGLRACLSIMLGAVLAWLVVAPYALEAGFITVPMTSVDPWGLMRIPNSGGSWYGPVIKWMLWPGVAMMVTAALTSFSFSWRSVLNALTGSRNKEEQKENTEELSIEEQNQADEVPRSWFMTAFVISMVLSIACQVWLFGIGMGIATFGVLLTFLLAVVAGRVSGETGITPVGPMGKVTQLTFGALSPNNVTANLMAANVTGGAASQCADLLHDLKTGHSIGASPRFQTIAQAFGVLAGALAGSAAYLILIPDPAGMLMTEEWAAPAVAQWKAVAEVFKTGLSNMPAGSINAIIWAGSAGIILAILEKVLPKKTAVYVPSPASIGLAFVIPAFYSISFFIGGVLAFIAHKIDEKWAKRFVIVLAAGLIAGESLTGMVMAFLR